jgi:hypothetical protein
LAGRDFVRWERGVFVLLGIFVIDVGIVFAVRRQPRELLRAGLSGIALYPIGVAIAIPTGGIVFALLGVCGLIFGIAALSVRFVCYRAVRRR